MGLSSSDLKAAIVTKLEGLGVSERSREAFAEYAQAIAEAIVEHLQEHAEVSPGTMEAGGDAVTGAGAIE